HTPTVKEIKDTLHARRVLECEITKLAAVHITPVEIEILRSILLSGNEALATKDSETLLALNDDFHKTIADAAGNSILERTMEQIRKRVAWYFADVVATRAVNSWNEHAEILKALEKRDGDLAASIMEQHVGFTQESI